jgi:hypothetical protein
MGGTPSQPEIVPSGCDLSLPSETAFFGPLRHDFQSRWTDAKTSFVTLGRAAYRGFVSTVTFKPNIPQLSDEEVSDADLRAVIDSAAETKSPPPSWYRTMGNTPDVAKEFAGYWDMLHRGGDVEGGQKAIRTQAALA